MNKVITIVFLFILLSGCPQSDSDIPPNTPPATNPDKAVRWHNRKVGEAAWINTESPDIYEDDDSAELATFYTVNSSPAWHTFFDDPADWISFDAVAGRNYKIETWVYGYCDTELYLYNANNRNEPIKHNDDKPGGTYGSFMDWPCAASGTYYFKIGSYKNKIGSDMEYCFSIVDETISTDDFENDDSFLTANEIFINEIQVHTFSDDPNDYVRFSATPDYIYKVSSTIENSDTIFEIYNAAGELLAQDDDSGSDLGSKLYFIPETSGTYYLKISSYNNYTGVNAKYNIELTRIDRIKKWTVIVYMSADNDLNNAGIRDIEEMKLNGSNADINIVVLWDGSDISTHGYYYIEKGEAVLVKDLDEINMGTQSTAENCIDFVTKYFPAEQYLMDFWNHGSGPDRTAQLAKQRGVCWDYTSEDYLTDVELKNIMEYFYNKIGKKIDIIGFDACLMASLEIAYQFRDYAAYMVASEENEPFDGWDYNFLQELIYNPNLTARDLSDIICSFFLNYYAHYYNSIKYLTMSSFNLQESFSVVSALNSFCEEAINSGISGTLFNSISDQVSFFGTHKTGKDIIYTRDLTGYMESISLSSSFSTAIQNRAQAVITAINTMVVVSVHGEGYTTPVNGLSITLKADTAVYSLSDLCIYSLWNEYLSFCEFL